MKRLLCAALALGLWVAPALAQPASETQPLTGSRFFPDGSDAANAGYAFTCRLPQFAQTEDDAEQTINAYLSSYSDALLAAAPPDEATNALATPGSPAMYTHVDYRIACNDDDTLSVLLTSRQFLGNAETESWTGLVFARSGVYAGKPLTLSQATGLEQNGGATGDGSYASQLAYGLVWSILQQQMASGSANFDPDLTEASLQSVFHPESDFYMDENRNFVFYLQPGAVASEVDGILTFPFSLDELLSAV